MSGFGQHLFQFFFALGIWGPFALGIIDALLFTPLANDVLIVALTARHRERAYVYAAMATAGSVIGCAILATISRKGGEAGLEKSVSPKKLEKLKKTISNNAAWALLLASIMPPPFPFTPIVAGAAALQYSRTKLLAVVGVGRAVRFTLLAYLALRFGKAILRWAELPAVRWSIIVLIVLSIGGSVWTIWTKLRRR